MTSEGEKLFPFISKQLNEYGEIKEFLKNNENNDSMLDWELRMKLCDNSITLILKYCTSHGIIQRTKDIYRLMCDVPTLEDEISEFWDETTGINRSW